MQSYQSTAEDLYETRIAEYNERVEKAKKEGIIAEDKDEKKPKATKTAAKKKTASGKKKAASSKKKAASAKKKTASSKKKGTSAKTKASSSKKKTTVKKKTEEKTTEKAAEDDKDEEWVHSDEEDWFYLLEWSDSVESIYYFDVQVLLDLVMYIIAIIRVCTIM